MSDRESPTSPAPADTTPAEITAASHTVRRTAESELTPTQPKPAGSTTPADATTPAEVTGTVDANGSAGSHGAAKPAVTRATTPNWTPVLTVPNMLSFIRLLSVPLFLHLVLVQHQDLLAIAVLIAGGITDFLDGRLARAWGQVTRLGQLLDPFADRLYIICTVAALVLREIIPLWLALLLVLRDVVLAGLLLVLRHHGYGPPGVHYLGKAATFALMYGFPLLLLGAQPGVIGTVAAPVAWAFSIWGACLYYWAGGVYVVQCVRLIRTARRNAGRVTA